MGFGKNYQVRSTVCRTAAMITPKSAMLLLSAISLCGVLAGCSLIPYYNTVESHDDRKWLNGKFRVIANRRHYVDRMFSWESHSRLTSQEWILAAVPFPDRNLHRPQQLKFLKAKEEDGPGFLLISGSGLLIRRTGGKFALYDPQTGKDVSKPFASTGLFNRSRTACLAVLDGRSLILDTLSARTGEPKVLARPAWNVTPKQLFGLGQGAVLADDIRYLVLWTNGVADAYSTNGAKEHWALPAERKLEAFEDAESLNGKVVLLSRFGLDGGRDLVKLTGFEGEILCSGIIRRSDGGGLWNPALNSLLFTPYELSPVVGQRWTQTFDLWNYSSNLVQNVQVWK
jgi:hypothetical protein